MELVYLVYYCDAVSLEAIFDEQIQENWQFPEKLYDFGPKFSIIVLQLDENQY